MKQQECFDVTIIGGGPAGLFSAFYSGLREMKTKIIDVQPKLGGKVHLYPEKIIWDVGALTPVPGAKLVDQLVEQGLTFDPEVVLNEKIVAISRNDEGLFVLKAASGQEHVSKTVIAAVGGGILKPQKLQLYGADQFESSNLHYTVQSLKSFEDKNVIISGGGNSAIDWANALEPVARKVYVTCRKDCLSGHESQMTQLMNCSAKCFFNTSMTELVPSQDQKAIDQVRLTHHETGESFDLSVDDVLVNHGFESDVSLFENSDIGLELIDQCLISGNEMSESSVSGLYAAGDVLKHDGKLNLIAGAFQDAANAVNKAKQFVQPDAGASAMVSSHNEVFEERNRELVNQMVE
ncbi:NAD(P)/FAD-dependent oxidoreductase [Tuberibacillus sp. Marseille-P3662]|uniref:NAD(P)/FAD-dependent oxidoreductase n=1 Tax=Tuberibacillus sp. Marseille-P3662 TaxID=1965358 RepID=UPI000A1CB805|nr:NAD(P)/FAD-dependent oxidoreductase [Tuberibacillus sp. Marseille-P3662]